MRALFVFIALFALVHAKIVIVNTNNWHPNGGFPGLKLRLTRNGAEHLKTIAVRLLNEQLATLSGVRASHTIDQPPGISGNIVLTDVRTLAYQPPTGSHLEFAAPSFINFGIENLAISLTGRFLGISGLIQVPGVVSGTLAGMNVALSTSFRALTDGSMSVAVANCSTTIAHSSFALAPEGPLSPIIRVLETQINELIIARIPSIFCRSITDLIERHSPTIFAKLNRVSLSEHFKGVRTGTGVIDDFVHRLTSDGLYIDGRQIASPIITRDFFETQQNGELRYEHTIDSTPFFPPPIACKRVYELCSD